MSNAKKKDDCTLTWKLYVIFLLLCYFVVCYAIINIWGQLPPSVSSSISQRSRNGKRPAMQDTRPQVCINVTCDSVNVSSYHNQCCTHLIVSKQGNQVVNSTLTESLWSFLDIGDQQLYLYEVLLSKEWIQSRINAEHIRKELVPYLSRKRKLIPLVLSQQTCKAKGRLEYAFGKATRLTTDVHKRLPKVDPLPPTTRFKSCAVIGNSGSLLNSSCGALIDQHDYVFRCNLAPLLPFRADAGEKNNLTTMNPSLIISRFRGLSKNKGIKELHEAISKYNGLIWIPCYANQYAMSLSTRALKVYQGTEPRVVCGDPSHFRATAAFWKERGITKRLSTGFYLTTTALQVCDEVHLYGFWPFSARYSKEKLHVPYHYFNNMTWKKVNVTHSMDTEFNYLVQLHNMGVIRMHMGSCR